ncbi:MAG: bifunctional proline dehydrogenase/L-glutamate gamma-semialdehyde dehydrogenase PutA [Legionellaceae bacterium]|nr:bifunctional proline dehydrogenase/L-glutamate gamma-semialdehyde dehydrogenase PutA [Legionellaceae bacterium]
MLKRFKVKPLEGLMASINEAYRIAEPEYLPTLIEHAHVPDGTREAIEKIAMTLVEQVRAARKNSGGIDSFLNEYSLSSEEGVALMCLAEALLRVPDSSTIDSLIKDKIAQGNWQAHRGQSASFFVNATTWALMLTGRVLSPEQMENRLSRALMTLVNRSGEGVVRKAVDKAMRIMSKQFVTGRTITEALQRAKKMEAQGYLYSYDMLGEAALTEDDAQRYLQAYRNSIEAIGKSADPDKAIAQRAGISIKLSALYPRYHETHREIALEKMVPRVLELAQLAKAYDIGLTVDAEESERLMLSLELMEQVFCDRSLAGWHGFGLAVQSYQKRAFYVLDWVAHLARSQGRRINVRLIKGAYWDSEIKKAQMQGLSDYPVFTRKVYTDVSFQACAKKLLSMTDAIYPQFATHNAYSVAVILQLAGDYRDFEFQCLHGMGAELYQEIVSKEKWNIPCRIYAPVGQHEELLPYLVRRLLENGANSSFVNRIVDEKASIASLVEDPVAKAAQLCHQPNQLIVPPADIFLPERKNSRGLDLSDRQLIADLQQRMPERELPAWTSQAVIVGKKTHAEPRTVYSPMDKALHVGSVMDATEADIDVALQAATQAFTLWSKLPVAERALKIERFAALLETHREAFYALACFEAGKTWFDAVAEVREAIDFCYYYAEQARAILTEPKLLKGYTGERNELSLHPRGIVLCISPWNFPLAIFTGQIIAALVTGNCVIAKPAEQTPLIAAKAVALMHEAGIPAGVVQLLPGDGARIGGKLVADKRVKAVVFTGSTQTAALIAQTLAQREGEMVPLIAETGGQNVMIVDSSALLEQVTSDVLISAFGSAGQRCSALRVLYLQDEIYDRTLDLIKGAMRELVVDDPRYLSTDVGPVIDEEARSGIADHIAAWEKKGRILAQCSLSDGCAAGFFIPPTAIAIDHIADLPREIFGPVLHIIRYRKKDLDRVIDDINATGYGLTFGIHSRINHVVEDIRSRVHVGNCYVNRNITGAIVGLQPFGGEGLSGTGPKAGGPHYLYRFCHERHCCTDTTAAGGNASLMALEEG